jgi:hypothetical protein
MKKRAKAATPAKARKPKAKAPVGQSVKKPVSTPKSSTAPRMSPAPNTSPAAGHYTPREIQGVGWKPFRYPPS